MVNCTLFIDNLLYVGYPNGKFVKVEGILQSVDELTKDGGSLVRKISKIPCNFTILGDFKNEIRYIGKIDDNNILISLINGELWKYDIGINIATKIFDFERTIWRALVINNSIIIAIGKYGFFVTLKYINSKWEVENNLNYTNNSMFCLDLIKENTFFVNDYRGNNYIKKIENDKLVSIEVTDSIGNIQHAYKISENSFATISLSSRIEVFDYENIELYKWNESSFNVISYKTLAYQSRVIFDLLEYPGKDIIASKNYILAMTNYEILFIDIMSLKTEILKFENQLHSLEKIGEYFIVVANDSRIWLLDPEKIIPISEIINYECKIGLIGTSNVGKSTLCHYLQNNELVNLDSSFGRKIWLLDNPRLKLKDKHYISLYDIAGQRGQVFTHFPNMKNNSHIFLVANQRIRETLDDIILNLPFIRQHVNKNCKFHLIITHADVKNDDTIGIDFDDIIKKYGINNYFRIGLKENYLDSVNQIFNLLTEITTQNHFQKIIISETTYKIRSYINSKFNSSIKDKKLELLSPEDISKNLELPMETVKYNLKRLDERGEIEFIEFANTIAINFKFYNKLKTEIPNYIRNQDGIVTYNTLINQFDEININYINYIIKSLQKNGFLYITDIHTFDRNKNNPKNIISHIVIPFHLKELDNVN
ncbi:MAG: hypothetical protein OEY49_12180, partial [Candidatus Heimdallarchaeota archaeon]|nr:hypothetical protein [Candidatus Heimdallarchaeota archaeon]